MGWIIFLVSGYLLLCFGLSKVFPKAGFPSKDAWIPGKNFGTWCELIGRKRSHAWWLLFPIVNFFTYSGMAVDLVRSFGHLKFWHSFLAVVGAPIYSILLGNSDAKYEGPILTNEKEYKDRIEEAKEKGQKGKLERLEKSNKYKKSGGREWAESIIFAVFAAAFIRMFFIEMYKIPTPSMEGSLLVGDFLCVSKAHYGIRTPSTITMIPLLHNRIPGLNRESYLEKPNIPSVRLPALESIDRLENVVFNYPEGDSVIVLPGRTWSYYDVKRLGLTQHPMFTNAEIVTRPTDKKDHYIKRCIGLPGDKLQIIDKIVHINDAPIDNPDKVQFSYQVTTQGQINLKRLDDMGIDVEGSRNNVFHMTNDQVEELRGMGFTVTAIAPERSTTLFPHDTDNFGDWTVDNYGPIMIPAKDETISLTKENVSLYRRIIEIYEGNELSIQGDQIMINNEAVTSYTFQMDYYWMMGDNRHNSEDSRVWGFVPQDHVVGKPLFIWMSTRKGSFLKGIRWNRLFTGANKF